MKELIGWLAIVGLIVALVVSVVQGAPAKSPMPSLSDYDRVGKFFEGCDAADPFYVWVESFRRRGRADSDRGVWDAFRFTYQVAGGGTQPDARPYLILLTDGKGAMKRAYHDFDRDGTVDFDDALDIVIGDDARELVEYVCGAARRLR